MRKISIDPISRIEGHLGIELDVEDGVVRDARCSGPLFRGFEVILKGRDPRDAPMFAQRICGVCPLIHAKGSVLALDSAFGISDRIPDNGRIVRNLLLGSNFLQSHVLHFYHLAALDFVDVTAVAGYGGADPDLNDLRAFAGRGPLSPLVPRYEGDYRFSAEVSLVLLKHYVEALRVRRKAHEMLAVFGGKVPHQCGMVPGGVTKGPDLDSIAEYLWRLREIQRFVDETLIPDAIALGKTYPEYMRIGRGCGRYLSFGGFSLAGSEADLSSKAKLFPSGILRNGAVEPLDPSKIEEELAHSWYDDSGAGPPSSGETIPLRGKDGAYSWLKSPRYEGQVFEVGPLARMLIGYRLGHGRLRETVDPALSALGIEIDDLRSTMGRHVARAIEAGIVARALEEWVLSLRPGEPFYVDHQIPEASTGMGLHEAPRGSLGHWVKIAGGRIERYQVVSPTTWNGSPQDSKGAPGPIEQALIGTRIRDPENPFEAVRIVRSFDPCLACSVQVIAPSGRKLVEYRIA